MIATVIKEYNMPGFVSASYLQTSARRGRGQLEDKLGLTKLGPPRIRHPWGCATAEVWNAVGCLYRRKGNVSRVCWPPRGCPRGGDRGVRMLGTGTVSSRPWVVENGKEFLLKEFLGVNKWQLERAPAALKSTLWLRVLLQSCREMPTSSCISGNYCNLVAGTPSPPAAASHGTPQKCAKSPPAALAASWPGQERGQEQGWGRAVPAQPGRRSPQTPHKTGNFCENIGIYLKRLIRYDFTVPPHIFISYFI